MAMARRDSVTVSMAADMRGVFRVMLRVRRVAVRAHLGGNDVGEGGDEQDVVEGKGFRYGHNEHKVLGSVGRAGWEGKRG